MGAGHGCRARGIGRPWLSCAAAPVGGIGPDSEERPGSGKLPVTTPSDFRAGALFVMDDTRWDHGLTVTGEGKGLVGHAGAVLLRKLADQAGLTVALGSALARRGKFPLVDRGVALVSMAVAIVLGATSMADIAVLAHHAPVLGAEPSDTTVRRTLELADQGTPRQAHRVAGQERAPGGAARRPGAGGTACPVPRGEDRAAVRGPLRPDRPLGPVPGRAGADAAGDGTARPEASARLAALAEAADDDDGDADSSALTLIKSVPGNVSLDSMLTEIGKLDAVRAIGRRPRYSPTSRPRWSPPGGPAPRWRHRRTCAATRSR